VAVASTLAYFKMVTIMAVKSSIVQALHGIRFLPSKSLPREPLLRGRLSSVDLLIKVACSVKDVKIFSIKNKLI
jgi:hypothetical protein